MTAQNPPAIQTTISRNGLLWTLLRFRELGISLFILILVALWANAYSVLLSRGVTQ